MTPLFGPQIPLDMHCWQLLGLLQTLAYFHSSILLKSIRSEVWTSFVPQLNYSEKGVHRLMDLLKTYQVALHDEEVLDCFKASSTCTNSTSSKI